MKEKFKVPNKVVRKEYYKIFVNYLQESNLSPLHFSKFLLEIQEESLELEDKKRPMLESTSRIFANFRIFFNLSSSRF